MLKLDLWQMQLKFIYEKSLNLKEDKKIIKNIQILIRKIYFILHMI